jgi:hypothetical protein
MERLTVRLPLTLETVWEPIAPSSLASRTPLNPISGAETARVESAARRPLSPSRETVAKSTWLPYGGRP